ncbi:MAG: hypothetical protein JWM47_1157 [Acidimicrobiales bacterium]|nr:hypothetical protein [Acidimicrobiales bacterium]
MAPELFDALVEAWGPVATATSVRHEASGLQINLLVFVAPDGSLVRFVTHGLGRAPTPDGTELQLELILAARPDLGGVEPEQVAEFVLDVGAHLLTLGLRPTPPMLMPPTELSPWTASALLFDEPLHEPEAVAALEVDGLHVHLLALLPLHPLEHDHLDRAGSLEGAIDELAASLATGWTDLGRPPSPLTWLELPRS